VAVVSGAFAWDDIGTWEALARVRPKDPAGNVIVGPAVVHECHDCIIWSSGEPIVVSNMQELVVVEANGRVLVMPRQDSADLKKVLDALPPAIRDLP
jgi:mannose-1-phosphate guanylyltransferase